MGLFSLALVTGGLTIGLGGTWLHWDMWQWTWYHPWQNDSQWGFCYPYYVLPCVPAATASKVFDLGSILIVAGFVILFGTGMFMLGFYIRSRSWPM
jgi:hypothetical protein